MIMMVMDMVMIPTGMVMVLMGIRVAVVMMGTWQGLEQDTPPGGPLLGQMARQDQAVMALERWLGNHHHDRLTWQTQAVQVELQWQGVRLLDPPPLGHPPIARGQPSRRRGKSEAAQRLPSRGIVRHLVELRGNWPPANPPPLGHPPIARGRPNRRRGKALANLLLGALPGNRPPVGPPLHGHPPIAQAPSRRQRDKAGEVQSLPGQGIK
jgi:hypothetical protein